MGSRVLCIISPSLFLADCRRRRLNRSIFCLDVVVCFFELYLVCVFSSTVLFVSQYQYHSCEVQTL